MLTSSIILTVLISVGVLMGMYGAYKLGSINATTRENRTMPFILLIVGILAALIGIFFTTPLGDSLLDRLGMWGPAPSMMLDDGASDKSLVLLAAGAASTHALNRFDTALRAFDFFVSTYDGTVVQNADATFRHTGNKWRAVHALGDRLDEYEYVFIPDDDILVDVLDVNRAFDLAGMMHIDIAQPALAPANVSHEELVRRPEKGTEHPAPFVEVQMPILSRKALRLVRQMVAWSPWNMTGWGYDVAWSSWGLDLAVFHQLTAVHTRAVDVRGGATYANADPYADFDRTVGIWRNRPPEPVRVILCMIVRNEEATLPRCLASVIGHIDAACVCDTGSTDNTREVAAAWGQESGIPTCVESHAWTNFGENRTRALDCARAMAADLGWGESSYALLLDADMELRTAGGADNWKHCLAHDGYLVRQETPSLDYWNVRLVRLSVPWHCVGPTHEYWTGGSRAKLSDVSIADHGDGGFKADKFERDAALLEEAHAADPTDARTVFYLAQTHRDMGDPARALDLYTRRIDMGGWDEEVWYSTYQAGRMHALLGNIPDATAWLLNAYDLRPSRAEPLRRLAAVHAAAGRARVASLFSDAAAAVPYPADDVLFVEKC